MKKQVKILIAAVAGIALVATVATAVVAAPRGTVPTPTTADYQAWGCGLAGGDYTVIAGLLGLTPAEITAQLAEGKSLVEIAATKGVTEDQLVAAILDPMKQFMQQNVISSVWTQAQLDARLKLAEQHIRLIVNTQGTSTGFGIGPGAGCGGAGTGGAGFSGGRGGMMGGFGGGMMGGFGGTGTNSGFGGGMMGGWGRTN